MNSTLVKNILTPICGVIAAWLATKLNFLGIDAGTWNTLVSTTALAAVTAVLAYFNKTINLMDTVGNQPGTTVVTTPENAAALPANNDVIAATPQVKAAVQAAK